VNNTAGTYIDCVRVMIIFIVIIIIILVTFLTTFLLGSLHLSHINGRIMLSQEGGISSYSLRSMDVSYDFVY